MFEHDEFFCPQCMVGRCRPGRINFTSLVNGQLLTVPDVMMYICDVCEYKMLSDEAYIWLDRITDFEGRAFDQISPSPPSPTSNSPDSSVQGKTKS